MKKFTQAGTLGWGKETNLLLLQIHTSQKRKEWQKIFGTVGPS